MKGIGSDRRERLFTNCLQPADKCGEGVRQDKSQVRREFLTLIFTPSVTAREWGNRRFHRRGWERRFFCGLPFPATVVHAASLRSADGRMRPSPHGFLMSYLIFLAGGRRLRRERRLRRLRRS